MSARWPDLNGILPQCLVLFEHFVNVLRWDLEEGRSLDVGVGHGRGEPAGREDGRNDVSQHSAGHEILAKDTITTAAMK